MASLTILSPAEQVAARLRADLLSGMWGGRMPGVLRLEAELGVNRKAIEAAMRLLEHEGLLVAEGPGRRRRIVRRDNPVPSGLRVAILASEPADMRVDYLVELRHQLIEAGYQSFFADDTLADLKMDVERVAQLVERSAADAWVVVAGSRQVLGWFARCGRPAFALFGRRRGLALASAGPDKRQALGEAVRTLAGLGHRRIVLLARPWRRLPKPGTTELAFLNALATCGIEATESYHLPDWEESSAGFHARLDSLFQFTPPTALIVDEVPFFWAVMQFCSMRRLRVPQDLSLVCTDADPGFEWCQPPISHIRWASRPLVRRILRWAANVSHGRTDQRQTQTRAEFVAGGTIAPATNRSA